MFRKGETRIIKMGLKKEEIIYDSGSKDKQDIFHFIRCPYCLSDLRRENDGAVCQDCKETFYEDQNGILDLRLKKLKQVKLNFELGKTLEIEDQGFFQNFKMHPLDHPIPKKILRGIQWELCSYFPKVSNEETFVLDIGCEDSKYRKICEHMGYHYIGTDVNSSPDLSFLSDAHALPIMNNYFDLIIAYNLIEHLKYPFVAIQEIARVLKPGGLFIGVVSFLEPFHMESYYHHTHFGISNLLKFSGLNIQFISPSPNWDIFKALATMGFIPKAPKFLINLLLFPIKLFYSLWWQIAILIYRSDSKKKINRNFTKAGSYSFVARKE